MKSAAGEARNAAARATSSGVPQRPRERLARGPLLPVVGSPLAPGGANPARGEAVHADLRGERLGQAAREGHDRSFDGGEHLAAVAGHALLGLVPADVEDRRRRGRAFIRCADRARQFDRGLHIDLPQRLQLALEGPLGRFAGQHIRARGIHQHIDAVLPLPGRRGELGTSHWIGQISREDHRLASELPRFGG